MRDVGRSSLLFAELGDRLSRGLATSSGMVHLDLAKANLEMKLTDDVLREIEQITGFVDPSQDPVVRAFLLDLRSALGAADPIPSA